MDGNEATSPAPGEILHNTRSLYACGSNLFGQIQPICNKTCNYVLKCPSFIKNIDCDHDKSEVSVKTPAVSSASKANEQVKPLDVCISWANIVLKNDSRLTVFGYPVKHYTELVQSVAANERNIFCVDRNGTILVHQIKEISEEEKPSVITLNENVKCIASGEQHICLLTGAGKLLQIFQKDPGFFIYKPVETALPVKAVSCGKEHVLLLSRLGTVISYGAGSRGQLGHGSVDTLHTPSRMEALDGVSMIMIAAGGWHSAAVSEIGDLYIWGWNECGQLGLPCKSIHEGKEHHNKCDDFVNIQMLPSLMQFREEITVESVACGSRHTLMLSECGQVYSCGWNGYGQLGHGDTCNRDQPTPITYFHKKNVTVCSIFAGGWSSVFLTT